jgi:hypothetical protein
VGRRTSEYATRSRTLDSFGHFSGAAFDAGWQTHLVQAMASFGDNTGGLFQQSPIQPHDQASQNVPLLAQKPA